MTQYMLVFTLGPVQPFIQQARKTRDLWTGSLLLSKLMEAAMDGIEGEKFIFPKKRVVELTPDIPNKYIAVFADLTQAQAAAQQSQSQIAAYWQGVCNAVWASVMKVHADDATLEIWRRQTGIDPNNAKKINLDAFFDIYWAIVERQENQPYGAWFEKTEGLLAARKRLRDFSAKEEPGEKSAISGEREVLRGRGVSPREVQQFWTHIATNKAAKHSAKDIDQEGKERLDAIDTVKRFAMKAESIRIKGEPFQVPFPSTSSIATASFVESLLADISEFPSDVLKEWELATGGELEKSSMRDIPFLMKNATYATRWLLTRDGDLYFPETFVPRRLNENYAIPLPDGEALARRGSNALRTLLRATDERKITRPTPYYAVIQMDGDNMGILLSRVKEAEEHGKINQHLSSFANEMVPTIVERQYPARLVYAGGDDVLAFAPLARDNVENGQPPHVLVLAQKLQETYKKQVRGAFLDPQDPRLEKITASTGIVIAHHLTSLSYVLRSAREAEESAKKHYERNALVVTLIRRSGEQTRVGCRWLYPKLADEKLPQPIELFSRFYQLVKDDVLSPKCVHILLEEAPALVNMGAEAMQSEIKRVLLRQRDPAKEDTFKDVDAYAGHLVSLAGAMDADKYPQNQDGKPRAVELHADSRRYGLVEVLGWLLVMAFLARKEQE